MTTWLSFEISFGLSQTTGAKDKIEKPNIMLANSQPIVVSAGSQSVRPIISATPPTQKEIKLPKYQNQRMRLNV